MFYTRNNVKDVVQTPDYIGSTWKINNTMQVRTWLIPIEGWQIRIHHIAVTEDSVAYETGFAVSDSPDEPGEIVNDKNSSYFSGPKGFTGVLNLTTDKLNQKDSTIVGFPNTNLMTSEVVALPGRETVLASGEHWLITGVFANKDTKYALNKWNNQPIVNLNNNHVEIKLGTKQIGIELD